MNKKLTAAALLTCFMLGGCSNTAGGINTAAEETARPTEIIAAPAESAAPVALINGDDMFTDRDLRGDYKSNAVKISLEKESASCASPAVVIDGSTVTIKDEGVYILSGTLSSGTVIVDAENTDKVQLVLDNAVIYSEDFAAIYVKQAKKVFITLAEDTENTLSNGGDFTQIDDNKVDATVYSRDDLTINGTGKLRLKAPGGHGISTRDDLVITGGSYVITAQEHGLLARNSIRIAGGMLDITADKDAIHAEHKKDESKGYVYICGGELKLSTAGDALSASGNIQVDGGTLNIKSGGGSDTVQNKDNEWRWDRPDEKKAKDEDKASAKGIRAKLSAIINGGEFVIDSADDALHASADISITGGTMSISTGDDGIHADSACFISGGMIDITKSYEGIEGEVVDISGGVITVKSSDDGINASGGADMSGFGGFKGFGGNGSFGGSPDSQISISGGLLRIDAEGDGLDSNGSLSVSGGEVYIAGPQNGGNGAIDFEFSGEINGGTVVAISADGMAMNFSTAQNQGSVLIATGEQKAGTPVTLADSNGNEILSFESEKIFGAVLISCPEIRQGESYTLTAGSFSADVKMDSLIYSAGSIGMGHGMNGPGRPGDAKGERPEGMTERPERKGDFPGKPGDMPAPPNGFNK